MQLLFRTLAALSFFPHSFCASPVLSTVEFVRLSPDRGSLDVNALRLPKLATFLDGDAPNCSNQFVLTNSVREIAEPGVSFSRDGSTFAASGSADEGIVRVFSKSGDVWVQVGNDITELGPPSSYGTSVSLSGSGTILAVGAPTDGDDEDEPEGKVYVYEFEGGEWKQIGDDLSGFDEKSLFGFDVELSDDGSFLAVAELRTPHEDGSVEDTVRTFSLDANQITEESPIEGTSIASAQTLFYDVSLSSDGSVLARSKVKNDPGAESEAIFGSVRVYVQRVAPAGTGWVDIGGVDATRGYACVSVSLSGAGTLLAVGIENAVEVYRIDLESSSVRHEHTINFDGTGGAFMSRVRLSLDGRVLVATTGKAVTVYDQGDGGGWALRQEISVDAGTPLSISLSGNGDRFASAISTDTIERVDVFETECVESTFPTTIKATATTKTTTTTKATTTTTTTKATTTTTTKATTTTTSACMPSQPPWDQMEAPDSFSIDEGGVWGSISMSGDGKYLVAGSPNYGNNKGMVRIFKRTGQNKWETIHEKNGDSDGSYFGWSVSISGDGKVLAVVAKGSNDGVSTCTVYLRDLNWNSDHTFGKNANGAPYETVSLSENGHVIALGEPAFNEDPDVGGRVTIYEYSADTAVASVMRIQTISGMTTH